MDRALVWLAGALLVEIVLFRLFSRIGVFIPKDEIVLTVYNYLSAAGRVALNLVFVLSLALGVYVVYLLLTAFPRSRLGRAGAVMALPALLLAGGSALLPVSFTASPAVSLVLDLLVLAAVLLTYFEVSGVGRKSGALQPFLPGLGLVTAGVLLAYLYVIGQNDLLGWESAAETATRLFRAGELVTILAALALLWGAVQAVRGGSSAAKGPSIKLWRPTRALLALAGAAATAAGVLAAPEMFGILAMWSVGLSLFLPWPLYAAAFAASTYTVLMLLDAGRESRLWSRLIGFGILYVLGAGYLIQSNSQHLLILLGFLLFNLSARCVPAASPFVPPTP
ncbi:MAG: hypothetical protein HYY09_08665 [Firmicutes bacterium]|nr:hypothetical protein [Bacillota bacterium]